MSPVDDPFMLDRRAALKALAGAMAATMAGCSRPEEDIVPYVRMPEGLVAGEPLHYATTLTLGGYGRGFLATAIDGHPIKIEGNPRHPFSQGATDIFAEAEVLSLYDPDRSQTPRYNNASSTWADFAAAWTRDVPVNARVGLVTGRIVSPTALARISTLRRRFTHLRWYRYEPINDDMARAGSRQAFNRIVETLPRWEDADVILLFDADVLGHGPDQLRIARAYAARRHSDEARQQLHVVEPAWALTGAAADFRYALGPALIPEVARHIANALGADLGQPQLNDEGRAFAARAAAALTRAKGRAFVAAGESQSPDVHQLCHWINDRLRAPIAYFPSLDPVEGDHAADIQNLASDLDAGSIDALVIVDANPVYDLPDAWALRDSIAKVPFSAHFGLYADETAARCQWHLPQSHPLESWGDARALDGTASLIQPLIRRLYDTRTRDEILALLAGDGAARGYDLTRGVWMPNAGANFEDWWRAALHDGVIAGSASAPLTLSPQPLKALPPSVVSTNMTVCLIPDDSLRDGRSANNGWLQECPKPFTREVWGNAARISPADAQRLGVANEDTIEVTVNGARITLPAIISEAQADGVIVLSLGYGRWAAGRIGNGVGARVVSLLAAPARIVPDAAIRRSASTIPFRSTQAHTRLNGKAEELFRVATLASAPTPSTSKEPPPSLLPLPPRGDYAWAMVVNTDSCIGCNACVVACQAENNVPIVGPEEISQGRDMHWLRVDGYALPQGQDMRSGFQPVPCMHCELAPCEPVCPVEASVHDHEGLNVQVYNRCIGTRFCQANCPYKVRRFNWFDYAGAQSYGDQAAALKAQHNPDVSARGRGVMEKCNYCLQRISRARRHAEKEGRPIADGEVVTACQAACPTRAISFGDLNRTDSAVSTLRNSPHHYVLLEELNTRPRTTYMQRIYNSDGDSK